MKPTVPETGLVLQTEGDMAVVLMRGSESCRGCGAAAIGLCKASGLTATLTVKNTKHAVRGDTVTVALDRGVQRRGFLLAYGIPLLSLLGGSVLGHILGRRLLIPSMEVITGFLSLVLSSFFSFKRLRKLDCSSLMSIKHIVRDERHRPY